MQLLKAVRPTKRGSKVPGYSYHTTWLEAQRDPELRSALLAANVNILRQFAPYAYLCANAYTVDTWLNEDLGKGNNAMCRNERYVKQLQVGVCLAYPSVSDPAQTVVMSVLTGDILPFVHLLHSDEFALLCLPFELTLDRIDAIVSEAESGEHAAQRLVDYGGFIISIIDEVAFSAFVKDDWLHFLGQE